MDKFSKKFDINLPYRENHNIDPYYKPDVVACIKEFESDFKKTIYSKFRSENNIRRIVWSCYSFYLGHSKIRLYPILKIPNIFRKISTVLYNIFKDSEVYLMDRKKYSINNLSRIKLFCVNDTETATDADRQRAINFIKNYFPKKSLFEK